MSRRDSGFSPAVFEVLRLCAVTFCAGIGYATAGQLSVQPAAENLRLGPFDGPAVGIILGAAVGYLAGGALARLTGRTLRETERLLAERSAEQILAGLTGAVLGVLVGGGLSWPVLLVGVAPITLPVFAFVCLTLGTLGYRVGLARRDSVLHLLGQRAGLGTRAPLSALPRVLDTSVAIDGRIVDVVRAGFLHGVLLVPEPVLGELQALADAADDTRRARGRRGLDVLQALRSERDVDVEVIRDEAPEVPEVDGKLLRIALDREAVLLTLDTNLAKVAALSGCRVMNLHALAVAMRPPVAAGDTLSLLLTRAGKEPGQAVGYLDDGTMVVVEGARNRVGHEVPAFVTSVLTTANGRLVFARPTPLGVGHQGS